MTGDELRRRLAQPSRPRQPLVQDFLYERNILMVTGETGKGKTVLSAQLGVSLTASPTLFLSLPILHPCRVYYMQMEGDPDDFEHRLRLMLPILPFNPDYFYLDAYRGQRLDVMSAKSVAKKLTQMEQAFGGSLDVLEIDPIYLASSLDLSKADAALAFTRFLDQVLAKFQCAIVLFHHPHRPIRFNGRLVEEEDAFYGHSFLKNYMEISYKFRQLTADGSESELIRLKSREEETKERLLLAYHPETFTCSMIEEPAETTKRERFHQFLLKCQQQQHPTNFYAVKAACGLSTVQVRRLQREYEDQHFLILKRQSGKRTIWVPHLPEPS